MTHHARLLAAALLLAVAGVLVCSVARDLT